jgi:hypothetical protein
MGEPDDYSNRKRSRLPPRLVPPRSDRQHPLSVITPDAHEVVSFDLLAPSDLADKLMNNLVLNAVKLVNHT